MFDGPFDFFALIIAIIAFFIAIKASNQATEMRRRFNALEEKFYALRPVQPPPPLPTLAQDEAPAEPPPLAPEAEPASPPPVTEELSPPPLETSPQTDAPPPLPAAAPIGREPGFEEQLGTRWVVWIGGLALALGGFFMVR